MFVLEKAGIVAHQADGDLESGGRRDALIARAFLLQQFASSGVGHGGAQDFRVGG
jgi:hypothetical protein